MQQECSRSAKKNAKKVQPACRPTPCARAWSCAGLLSPDRIEAMPRHAGITIRVREPTTCVQDRRGSARSAEECK